MSDYLKPLPRIDARNGAHWKAREGRLMVQQCADCGTLRYPPAHLCPHCQSERSTWAQMSGRGEVWSWCTFHRAYFKGFEAEIPYTVVLVKLDEGPKLYSNLVDVPKARLRIGMRVRALFQPATAEVTLVKFVEDR